MISFVFAISALNRDKKFQEQRKVKEKKVKGAGKLPTKHAMPVNSHLCVCNFLSCLQKKLLLIETLGKNASATIVRPRPTTVAGNMNVSKTVPSSQMTLVKIQTRVSHHHSFVKGMITT